jgi:hypothetical protein
MGNRERNLGLVELEVPLQLPYSCFSSFLKVNCLDQLGPWRPSMEYLCQRPLSRLTVTPLIEVHSLHSKRRRRFPH